MLKSNKRLVDRLGKQLRKTAGSLERVGLREYVAYLGKPRRMLVQNFLAGVARGLGMAVGFTVLGAVVVIILQAIAKSNIPWIGSFVADIVDAVERANH